MALMSFDLSCKSVSNKKFFSRCILSIFLAVTSFLDIHYNIGVNQLFAQDISLLKIHHNTVLIMLYALPERAVYA